MNSDLIFSFLGTQKTEEQFWKFVFQLLSCYYGGPEGSITNQFTKTQNNFAKHKTFLKTQISFPKHKLVSQNTNRFLKTQTNFSKHKPISRNTNQFRETQINGLGTFSVIIRESLERTHSQDFPHPTWRHLHVSDNSSSLR